MQGSGDGEDTEEVEEHIPIDRMEGFERRDLAQDQDGNGTDNPLCARYAPKPAAIAWPL